jgi:hypothetical protein
MVAAAALVAAVSAAAAAAAAAAATDVSAAAAAAAAVVRVSLGPSVRVERISFNMICRRMNSIGSSSAVLSCHSS